MAQTATFGPERLPVSAYFAPRHPDDLDPEMAAKVHEALNLGLAKFGQLARERGITPWLIYMPCKARVHFGCRLVFDGKGHLFFTIGEP